MTATKQPNRAARQEAKRERARAQAEAAEASRRRAALLEDDTRTAAGKRDLLIEHTGKGLRGRSRTYAGILGSRSDATPERILTCERFDDLWHAARVSHFPGPKFEPQVDRSIAGGTLPENAGATRALTRLVEAVGQESAALLYLRIVENWSYQGLARESGRDATEVSALFVAAVDAAGRYFGIIRSPNPLVARAAITTGATP